MSRGTATERVVPTPLVATSRQRRLISGDRIFHAFAYAAAALIILIALVFVVAIVIPALPAITRFGLGFFISRIWDPVRSQFGALPAISAVRSTEASSTRMTRKLPR